MGIQTMYIYKQIFVFLLKILKKKKRSKISNKTHKKWFKRQAFEINFKTKQKKEDKK